MTMQPIEIYCDDPSHEGDPFTFEPLASNEHGWHPADWGKSRKRRYLQFLKETDHRGDPDRMRYDFRCKCGRGVRIRFERATVIFDTLARNGYERINLAGLAVILR